MTVQDNILLTRALALLTAAAHHNHDNPHQRQPAAQLTAAEAEAVVAELDRLRLISENYDYLSDQAYEVMELFCSIRDEFDGSEYQQGKKDGLRLALALVSGNPTWKNLNRGGNEARR